MHDLMVPVKSYEKEINKIKQQARSVMDSKEMVSVAQFLSYLRFSPFLIPLHRTHRKDAKNRSVTML